MCLQQPHEGSRHEHESADAAATHAKDGGASRNLASINPFFIVKDLQVSVSYYIERLGFQLTFQGPGDDPYYAGVSRDGIGIMLKAILPDVRGDEFAAVSSSGTFLSWSTP